MIVKTGSAPEGLRDRHGDFEQWFEAGLGVPCTVLDVTTGAELPPVSTVPAVVITGSPAMVSERPPWAEALLPWLRRAVERRPVLGVCFGHQLLAHALGGRVGPNPRGRIMASVEAVLLDAADDPLLGGFGDRLLVHCVHQEVVLEPPPGARLLARADHDPFHALRFSRQAWGVQFHPEFDAAVVRAYLERHRPELEAAGYPVDALLASARDDAAGRRLLRRFVELL